MKRYQTLLFDMDGTLLDTLDDLADAVNYALRTMAMPERTRDEIQSFVGDGVRLLMERAVPADIRAAADGAARREFERALTLFKEYYGAHSTDKTRPYDGILPLLRELKAEGYALATVSNKMDSAVKDLSRHYFPDTLSVAVGAQEGLEKKPAPDMLFAALDALGMPRDGAVCVGDSDTDLVTAKNAGLPCISVLWGFRDREFLCAHGATMLARTPSEIKEFL